MIVFRHIGSAFGFLFLLIFSGSGIYGQTISIENTDPRNILNGSVLPSEHYADQPYVIVCDDGSWVCTMTTSSGTEYAYMNHIVSTKSYDQGKTWTQLTDVEPSGIPQSSWAVPLKVKGGRIYVFYNYNENRHKGLAGVMSGPFAFKFSDDHGVTWSEERYKVDIPNKTIDEENFSSGAFQYFWCIDKPVVTEDAAYITYSKLLFDNPEGKGFYKHSEGFILKSENIHSEQNPAKIKWSLLPESDRGIHHPQFRKVQAEHNMEILDDGSLYVVYRTEEGHPVYSISRDDGKTFTQPKAMRYASGGIMANPRACPKIYKTKSGKYLFWYHNNFRSNTYQGRNPAWISGGVEQDGDIKWSQPEILLFDMDPESFGMSYPDFIEQDGKIWVIETQKSQARVHQINGDLLTGMWNQYNSQKIAREGLVMDVDEQILRQNRLPLPQLPSLFSGGGISIELWLQAHDLASGKVLLSSFGPRKKGFEIALGEGKSIQIKIHDGEMRDADGPYLHGQIFQSDTGVLSENTLHHIVFTLDGASKISSIVVDGILSDGSLNGRDYGWGRIHTFMGDLNDAHQLNIYQEVKGTMKKLRIYDRYLTTSEAISNYQAGLN